MSARFSASRKRAFLKALAETGNATISAERARVSRSWALLHRKGDADFAAGWEAALGESDAVLRDAAGAAPQDEREGLETGPPLAPPASGRGRWKYLDGAELVVGGSNKRRMQVRRARVRQWTPRVEERFLAALAGTCNVKAACAEAGMSFGSAYAHRQRWRTFAERWDAAVETGFVRIEAALVEAGCNLFSAPEMPPAVEMRDMTAAQALQLLHMHKNAVHGLGKAPGRQMDYGKQLEKATRNLERTMRSFGLLPRD